MSKWWEERTLPEKVATVVLIGLGAIGLIFLFGLVVKALWNWLMPEIFGLPEITYWQAWGLLILSSILFKDFGSGSSDGGSKRSDRKRKRKLREYMEEADAGLQEDLPEMPETRTDPRGDAPGASGDPPGDGGGNLES